MKKSQRRIVAGFLIALMLAPAAQVYAEEADALQIETDIFGNVISVGGPIQYEPNETFSDVSETDWFYNDVTELAGMGAVNGYPDGSFQPQGEITCAEFTKILLSTLGYEIVPDAPQPEEDVSEAEREEFGDTETGEPTEKAETTSPADDSAKRMEMTAAQSEPEAEPEQTFKTGTASEPAHWAQAYIDTARREGILSDDEVAYTVDEPITRALMIRMMVKALGLAPTELNEADEPFVDEADGYANTAWMQYLLNGYTENEMRYFKGENCTTRAEAAAVVLRAYEYTDNPLEFKEEALLQVASFSPLNTKIELINYFCMINQKFSERVILNSKLPYEAWTEIYQIAAGLYPEYIMSRGYNCSYYKNSNQFIIEFIYETDTAVMQKLAEEADYAASYAARLIQTATANPIEQLQLAHDYIIKNCKYDYDNYITDTIPFEAYTAYGALIGGSAVCQGYSAAFNLLCTKLGIDSYSVTGSSPDNDDFHMWNAVRVNGETYFVDVTFDDPVTPSRTDMLIYDNFLCTPKQFTEKGYTWKENVVDDLYYSLVY